MARRPTDVLVAAGASAARQSRPAGGGDEAWIKAYLADVEAGHASRTLALAEAIRAGRGGGAGSSLARLGVEDLRRALEQESSAAARNRVLRRWLSTFREEVVRAWDALNFPAPPRVAQLPQRPEELDARLINGSGGCGDRAPRVALTREDAFRRPAGGNKGGDVVEGAATGVHCSGVAIFDFDQTLSTRHVGVFEGLDSVEQRSFGGADRVAMLRNMLEQLKACGVVVAVVSRNSKHVVSRTLKQVSLFPYVAEGFIFGFEDYDDEVPKSAVVLDRIMPAFGTQASAILFVDDDLANIKDMKANCPTATLLHCPRSGIGQEQCAEIASWAARLADGSS